MSRFSSSLRGPARGILVAGVFASLSAGAACTDGAGSPADPRPTLSRIVLTPKDPSVRTGGTVQFQAAGEMSDGSLGAAQVAFTATGGAITPGGLFTAGSTAGLFRVVATAVGTHLADTATVVVTPAGSGGTGQTRGLGPADFARSAVVTGEDWQGITDDSLRAWQFFRYHESVTSGVDPVTGGHVRLVGDGVFGTAVEMTQDPATWTVYGGRRFHHPRARPAAPVVREWIYSSVVAWSDNWGEGNWKMMFAHHAEGTARVEVSFVVPGERGDMNHMGELRHWTWNGTIKDDRPVRYHFDRNYYQTVMFVKRLSDGTVRMGWAMRPLTTNGGTLYAPGPWKGIADAFDPGVWDDGDGVFKMNLGETKNTRPSYSYQVYYGPWVVLDLSDPNAPGDPWGVFSHFGI